MRSPLVLIATLLAGCSVQIENDPFYEALLANPPSVVPTEYHERLRQGRFVCEVFNTDQPDQFMTCWFPGGIPILSASLIYYGPNPLNPPNPSQIETSGGGGKPVTGFLNL